MVLENPSTPSSETFPDDAPASDDDRYSITPGNPNSVRIEASKLPKPMPIVGPMLGYNKQLLAKMISGRAQQAVKTLQRDLTTEEMTVIAYWTAKRMSIVSYAGPAGMAGGLWRAYQTRNTFKIPLLEPKNFKRFNPTAWPDTRLALLSGSRAVAAWHVCRGVVYGGFGNFIGKVLGLSYGMSVETVGLASDPRMKDYAQAVMNEAQRARGRLPNQAQQRRAVDGVQQKDASVLWRDHRRPMDDDASPTSGVYGDTEPRSADIPVTPEKKISEPGPPVQGRRRGSSAQAHDGAGPPNGLGRDQQALPFDDLDEASPMDGRDAGRIGVASGSAWERIRQQAGTPATGGRRRASPLRQTEATSSPSSRTRGRDRYHDQERPKRARHGGERNGMDGPEADRELARVRAQEEFDARVEQERRGGDFGGDQGEHQRW